MELSPADTHVNELGGGSSPAEPSDQATTLPNRLFSDCKRPRQRHSALTLGHTPFRESEAQWRRGDWSNFRVNQEEQLINPHGASWDPVQITYQRRGACGKVKRSRIFLPSVISRSALASYELCTPVTPKCIHPARKPFLDPDLQKL